jgi:hypothetical protein
MPCDDSQTSQLAWTTGERRAGSVRHAPSEPTLSRDETQRGYETITGARDELMDTGPAGAGDD